MDNPLSDPSLYQPAAGQNDTQAIELSLTDNVAFSLADTSVPMPEGEEITARAKHTGATETLFICPHDLHPSEPTFMVLDRKNLVVCIDGTSNQFGSKNTNVAQLYSRLNKNKKQLTYYSSGIGTYAKSGASYRVATNWLASQWDMMFALNVKELVLEAYRWLSDNSQPGDCIFLFGFSRGAYQVRIIAGMIKKVGLLFKGNDEQIPYAYDIYMSNIKRGHQDHLQSTAKDKAEKLCEDFKKTLSYRDVNVHFLGVWDTVSSIGITRGPCFPETATGIDHVCYVRHGVSLDDCRGKFLPEHVNGGAGPRISKDNKLRDRVKEVWFVGAHSDVGGVDNTNSDPNIINPSLWWMIGEALHFGLEVQLEPADSPGEAHHPSSVSKGWFITDLWPFRRLTYKDSDSIKRWPPHLGRGRHILPGQLIHESVWKHIQAHPEYTPAASHVWDAFRQTHTEVSASPVTERNIDSPAIGVLVHVRDALKISRITQAEVELLRDLLSSAKGKQSLTYAAATGAPALLVDALRDILRTSPIPADDITRDAVSQITKIMNTFPSLPPSVSRYPKSELRVLLQVAPLTEVYHVERVFGGPLYKPSQGHKKTVSCVTYCEDKRPGSPRYIASASFDGTIRLWNAQTGESVGAPLKGHKDSVTSIAFSGNLRRIVSGSCDKTIRLWNLDAETPDASGAPMVGHDRMVLSVAFSTDGTQIASGSADQTVRLWDATSGSPPLCSLDGHRGSALSVAFSPDGRFIASGSDDKTIRIWSTDTRSLIRTLHGHSAAVKSIAFTPLGESIVSGSNDTTVRVWNLAQDTASPVELRGHADAVNAVAVSPKGEVLISGSSDQTIRLWDAKTGAAVGEPMRGHKSGICSVIFSPDSSHVASGSKDTTMMVWEVDLGQRRLV